MDLILNTKMSGAHPFLVTSLFLCLISISTFHPTYSKPNGGFSLKLIPRDSPESPLYPGNLTVVERIQRMIKFTKARAHNLDLISSSNYSTIEPNNLGLIRDYFFYIVQVGIGTPVEFQFLLMDTGGGLIWTQCEPCINCYPQTRTHIFDPSRSSTYRRLPCDHFLCHGDLPLYKCFNDECVYNIGYGGGSTTRGVVSFETFTFPLDATRTIDNIIFGCSNDNRNIQFSTRGVISGIMGLSLSPDSLVSQLADQTQRRFSYCLVPFTEAQMHPSVVRFGDTIPLPSSNVYTTPFVTPGGSHYYHLNLLDISVGMRQLMFPPGTFTARQGISGGFFIDSGTVISQLDQNLINERSAYQVVMGAFQNHYDSFHLQRLGRVPEGLPLCYKYPPTFNQFASLTYHLEGGNYVVDPKYVNFYNTQAGYFCVAMMPGTGKSILGAWHQQNMRVTYNGAINSLQFSTETCANDHL